MLLYNCPGSPTIAKGKMRTGPLWTDVRNDRPFDGRGPSAAMFFYASDRADVHPEVHITS
ncbi:hypothetical protein ACVIJ6_003849 [Bradyrhizobium sp. USDA 4369]